MLVHVSRFKGVHQHVYDQILEWLTELKRALKYRIDDTEFRSRLRALWDGDFMPTSAEVRARLTSWELQQTTWSDIERCLVDAADKIRVQVVNSEMRDAIDYESNAESGLSIIAIGGTSYRVVSRSKVSQLVTRFAHVR